MRLPLQISTKVGIVRRAKALGALLLPLLVFAAVVFLSFRLQSRLGTPRESQVALPRSEQSLASPNGWLFANSASSADATVEVKQALQGATTVTIYTITPKY